MKQLRNIALIAALVSGAADHAAAQSLSNVLLPPSSVVGNQQGTSSGASAITFAQLKVLLAVPTTISDISGLGAGVAAWLGTPSSANLRTAVTDETGTGALVFATSPVLVTPNLGTPSAGVLTNATGLPISTGVSGLGASVATALGLSVGAAGSPVVNGGALGTPASGTATNLTGTAAGLTAGTVTTNANLTGAVTSVGNAASLGSFTSANLRTALTDESGTGVAYFQGGDLGTPSAGVATNITALNATQLTTGTIPAARTNGHMNGTATNDNAAAGEVGEFAAGTAAPALTTNTPANCGQITLSAGDWDLFASGIFNGAGATVTSDIRLAINTSVALPTAVAFQFFEFRNAAGITDFFYAPTVGPFRVSLTGSTTYFCVAQATFITSTFSVTSGSIRARRAR